MQKGIILAGGKGSRLYPLTRATSKQLLPVYDKPMIYYPLSILMLAGIRNILLVSSPQDLPRFQSVLGDGSDYGISLSYRVQHEPLGIAHALMVAEDFIQKDPIALILGDNLFYGQEIFQILERAYTFDHGATVFGYPTHNPKKYGVLEFDAYGQVTKILEKPENPPSNYAVTGLYFYDERATQFAKTLKPSQRGEYEITDLNNIYLEKGALNVIKLSEGFAWLDSGNMEELQKASLYVKLVQEMHNTLIASIEIIAYEQGFIGIDQLQNLATELETSEYGKFLQRYLQRQVFTNSL